MALTEREETITEKVRVQAEAGFSDTEIRGNLLKEGFSREEIDPHLSNVSPLTSSQRQIGQTILISIAIFCLIKALDNSEPSVLNPNAKSKFITYLITSGFLFGLFILTLFKKKPFKGKKNFLLIATLFIVERAECQSVSLSDLQNYTTKSISISKEDLISKGFYLSSIQPIRQYDTIWTYRKGVDEAVYVGNNLISTNRRVFNSTTYTSDNSIYLVELLDQVKKAGFTYEEDKVSTEVEGKFIYVSNYFFKIQIFLASKEGEFSSILLVEK